MYNVGDIAWVLTSTALVWIMIPGVGFFYSGLLRRKNALSMLYLSMITMAVVSFQVRYMQILPGLLLIELDVYQWFFWGYSLAFSDTGSKFIGDLRTSVLC